MLKAIIVDDEKDARTNTINMVNTYCSNVQVLATAHNVASGVLAIKEHKPDLVLLDIDMPDGTGFDLLRQLMPINFMVIFITAHAEHAITAIKFNALDFLVKPLDVEDFLLALNKAENNKQELFRNERLQNLLNEIDKPNNLRIALGTSDTVHFVEPDQIIRIESDSNYSIFYLNDKRKVMVSKPLKEYAELLADYGFFRSHQSHLINLLYLKEYNKKDGGSIILKNNTTVPISQRKKDKLLDAFKSFKGK